MNDSEIREKQTELNELGVEEYSWMEGFFSEDKSSDISDSDMKDLVTNGRLIEGAYAQNHTLENVDVIEGITDIGEVAFFGCINLRSVSLPGSLKIIREEAFGESGLESVVIPENVEVISEKAFFSCAKLKRIDVLNENIVIEKYAFSDCPLLTEGYVACGYPQKYNQPEELQYTILWCTCPDRHKKETCEHAEKFIRENEGLIMEIIFKTDNAAALTGIVNRRLLNQENINKYVAMANDNKQTELVALLLSAIDKDRSDKEFEL